jgi:hypothetical protein
MASPSFVQPMLATRVQKLQGLDLQKCHLADQRCLTQAKIK